MSDKKEKDSSRAHQIKGGFVVGAVAVVLALTYHQGQLNPTKDNAKTSIEQTKQLSQMLGDLGK